MRSAGERRVGVRAIASVLAVLVLAGLAAGCSSGSTPKASELAIQDKAVARAVHLEAIRDQTAATERRLAELRRAAAIGAMLQLATRFPRAQVLARFGFALDDLCPRGHPHPVTRADRRAQREIDRQRRRALYYLNLSCPPPASRA